MLRTDEWYVAIFLYDNWIELLIKSFSFNLDTGMVDVLKSLYLHKVQLAHNSSLYIYSLLTKDQVDYQCIRVIKQVATYSKLVRCTERFN